MKDEFSYDRRRYENIYDIYNKCLVNNVKLLSYLVVMEIFIN